MIWNDEHTERRVADDPYAQQYRENGKMLQCRVLCLFPGNKICIEEHCKSKDKNEQAHHKMHQILFHNTPGHRSLLSVIDRRLGDCLVFVN